MDNLFLALRPPLNSKDELTQLHIFCWRDEALGFLCIRETGLGVAYLKKQDF
jgi:hypothetical protein